MMDTSKDRCEDVVRRLDERRRTTFGHPGCLKEAADLLTAQAARIAELERERDEALNQKDSIRFDRDEYKKLADSRWVELATLRAERDEALTMACPRCSLLLSDLCDACADLDEAVEVVRPFAELARTWCCDDMNALEGVTVSTLARNFQAARAFLSKHGSPDE